MYLKSMNTRRWIHWINMGRADGIKSGVYVVAVASEGEYSARSPERSCQC